ncbi:hypothetical protein RRSWK_06694 [Rhodopirellula sp. SWK7]|nr:hypothetical protein RRSWK_06694 [Rhodopirellula sp. SWK7]
MTTAWLPPRRRAPDRIGKGARDAAPEADQANRFGRVEKIVS